MAFPTSGSTQTNQDFDSMIKRYMPYEMMFEEVTKRDYFLGKVDKDQTWKGGEMQIPFMGAHASSISYGQLYDEALISEDKPVLGTVSGYKEIWGAMVFNDHDLQRHDNMAQSFLKILPDRLESFIERMKEAVSINLLNGSHIVSFDVTSVAAVANNDLPNGVVTVDRPARLTIGQFLEIGSVGSNKTATDGATHLDSGAYVGQIDISSKTVTLYSDKGLTLVSDLTLLPNGAAPAVSIAAGDKGFVKGATVAGKGFTSLRDQLLSAANGGSSTLFGISKLLYPHLQSVNFNGGAIDKNNILGILFDAYNATRELGKGNPTDLVMSFKNLGSCMRELELGSASSSKAYGRGDFSVTDTRVNAFGWTEIDVVGVKGKLTIVGVQEMDDDIIYMLDWRGVKLHSNGFFERRTAPDGKQFYETRSIAGYKYIIDTRFFGELVVTKPSHCGVIYGINYDL